LCTRSLSSRCASLPSATTRARWSRTLPSTLTACHSRSLPAASAAGRAWGAGSSPNQFTPTSLRVERQTWPGRRVQ
jgi:hypothetical protein